MERNDYFDAYIDELQREVFLLAYDSNVEIISFITSYMKSNVRRELDKAYSSWCLQSANKIFNKVLRENRHLKKVDNQVVNRDAIEWLAYFYSRWHFVTGESSKSILKYLPVKEGLKVYYPYHQISEIKAIEQCKEHYNVSRNNHRNNEVKNSNVELIDNEDLIFYSFLAIRLLYKLTRDTNLLRLEFKAHYCGYDFFRTLDDPFLRGDAIYSDEDDSIVERYKEIQDSDSVTKGNNSVYFCFIFSKKYSDEAILKKDIETLRDKYIPSRRKLTTLYFYMNGSLYEIGRTNIITKYYLPISKRDIAGVIRKMKENHIK